MCDPRKNKFLCTRLFAFEYILVWFYDDILEVLYMRFEIDKNNTHTDKCMYISIRIYV